MTDAHLTLPDMLGVHPTMRAVYRLVHRAAAHHLPVVVTGETGTGKELVAQALHALSAARDGPLIAENCAAISESLADGEFFGWERGAFTGAVGAQVGLLEAAHGGTLFLDEIGSISLPMQAKLLRAIEQGCVRPVGGRVNRPAVFRLVCAGAEPLKELVALGRMRPDFRYRIAGLEIHLPPLRERLSDLPILFEHFLAEADRPLKVETAAMQILRRYAWPGNVRELRMTVARLAAFTDGDTIRAINVARALPRRSALALDRPSVEWALAECGGSEREAARLLRVSRSSFQRRLAELGIRGSLGPGGGPRTT